MNDVLFSSKSEEWSTPQDLFDKLNEEFHFAIDAAATPENAKCKKYYTKHQNSLIQKWSGYGAVWCNPPYGRGIIHWVNKAYAVSSTGTTVVMLLPARTDTEWFHEYIWESRSSVY